MRLPKSVRRVNLRSANLEPSPAQTARDRPHPLRLLHASSRFDIWEVDMAEIGSTTGSAIPASLVLGRKLDSIPFSGYHVLIIAVLALVGFIEGYDLVMTGSLVVLAKEPLHLTSSDIRILVAFPTFMLTLGGFFFSAISDHLSRKIIVLIGVFLTTF